jgi:solute:Na+ symporter, SSS family
MKFQLIDLIAILLYLSFITLLGIYVGRSKSSNEYFLGGRNLSWIAIMISIIATETSSLTFLNVPGISYKGDFSFLQIAFGFIIGRIIVSYTLLPMYYINGYKSIYQWIGEAFGVSSQRSTSSVFLITRVLADGVRLYATSIPITLILNPFFNGQMSDATINILTLFVISFITLFYTVYGGFKSVVYTDIIQFFIYISGGMFVLIFIFLQMDNQLTMSEMFQRSFSEGKLKIFHGTETESIFTPYYLFNGIIAGIMISIGSHGVDQMFAQRLLACKNINESKYALIGSGIIVFFQFALFLIIGVLLYFHYQTNSIDQNFVFSRYIIDNIPSPILGLIIAAILASAMSTLSSSINSMSLSFIVDILKIDNEEESKKKLKIISLFWGIILFLSSLLPFFISESYKEGLVDLGLKITSFTFGPMIGLFFISKFKNKDLINIKVINLSILITILSNIFITYYFKLALFLIIPLGISIFFILLIFSNFINNIKNKIK